MSAAAGNRRDRSRTTGRREIMTLWRDCSLAEAAARARGGGRSPSPRSGAPANIGGPQTSRATGHRFVAAPARRSLLLRLVLRAKTARDTPDAVALPLARDCQ